MLNSPFTHTMISISDIKFCCYIPQNFSMVFFRQALQSGFTPSRHFSWPSRTTSFFKAFSFVISLDNWHAGTFRYWQYPGNFTNLVTIWLQINNYFFLVRWQFFRLSTHLCLHRKNYTVSIFSRRFYYVIDLDCIQIIGTVSN